MCTDLLCDATCSAIGDPHYTTFDGKQYDFMGQCSYYLVVGDNYTVEAENSECSDAVAEVFITVKFSLIFVLKSLNGQGILSPSLNGNTR